jgi:thioredoxin-dependent peroxiredoxin
MALLEWHGSGKNTSVQFLKLLRMIAATIAATATGAVTMAAGRGSGPQVSHEPGDQAPDFSLPGSDGRTYRLGDFRGRQAVVLAWFPVAFTGG